MNSQTLIKFSKSTSYLVIFVLFPLLHRLPCTSSKQELGVCESPFQCGEISAGFPFWGGNRPENCGLPQLELHCRNKSSTYLIISDQEYSVLKVSRTNYTITLARPDLLGRICSAKFNTTALPSDIFEILPAYKELEVYYLCDRRYFSKQNYTCPSDKGLVLVFEEQHGELHCNNSFTVIVRKSFVPLEEDEFDSYELERVIRNGFEVKVKIDETTCEECSSSGGICSFNGTAQVCCKTNSSPSGVSCEPKRQRSADEIYRLCSTPFFCGNQGGLLYPFWIPGREECGHPDFKLNCNGGFAELDISSVSFRILEANYDASIIRLARSDYIGSLCPLYPFDTPFILPFASNTELLTIYSHCIVVCSTSCNSNYTSIYVGKIDCEDGEGYYVTRNLSSPLLQGIRDHLYDFRLGCSQNVSIPASGPSLNRLQNNKTIDNLKNALEQGFELRLDQECSRCTESGGVCGYNQITRRFVCYCGHGQCNHTGDSRNKGISSGVKIGLGAGVILFTFLVLALGLRIIRKRKRKPSHDLRQWNLKTLNPQENLKGLIPLKQYSFAEVKRITKSFAEMVGKGGFGTVYRGTLSDGRIVAVKILKDSKSNGEDFINEVASISQTSHVNIVTLLGFCSEGSKRAIIYEFLENGSLDKFISSKRSSNMDWKVLYEIALGVARGLEYLHHGCRTRIVHFDIKPQNVLLDDNLCPKVSDFGLAKLCERKESMLSLLDTRGTIGYIAPEVFSRVYGRVSHKSDVYSYGMLVLEMIGARNKDRDAQEVGSSTSSMYFPEWIYRDLEKGDNGRLLENGINSEEEEEIAKKMTMVGLWCIQAWPSNRPPMNRVIEMMEGDLNALEFPPRPAGLQIPEVPLPDSSTLSDDISISKEYDP
ncbi:unnamed protein product [Brassica oleracea]